MHQSRRLPDLIYRLERVIVAANDVATRHKLPKLGGSAVALPSSVNNGGGAGSGGGGRKKTKGKRLRSRNAYIDQFLAEEVLNAYSC